MVFEEKRLMLAEISSFNNLLFLTVLPGSSYSLEVAEGKAGVRSTENYVR